MKGRFKTIFEIVNVKRVHCRLGMIWRGHFRTQRVRYLPLDDRVRQTRCWHHIDAASSSFASALFGAALRVRAIAVILIATDQILTLRRTLPPFGLTGIASSHRHCARAARTRVQSRFRGRALGLRIGLMRIGWIKKLLPLLLLRPCRERSGGGGNCDRR